MTEMGTIPSTIVPGGENLVSQQHKSGLGRRERGKVSRLTSGFIPLFA